jgi:hypothetical protein
MTTRTQIIKTNTGYIIHFAGNTAAKALKELGNDWVILPYPEIDEQVLLQLAGNVVEFINDRRDTERDAVKTHVLFAM